MRKASLFSSTAGILRFAWYRLLGPWSFFIWRGFGVTLSLSVVCWSYLGEGCPRKPASRLLIWFESHLDKTGVGIRHLQTTLCGSIEIIEGSACSQRSLTESADRSRRYRRFRQDTLIISRLSRVRLRLPVRGRFG